MALDPAKLTKLEAFLAALPDRYAVQLMEACAEAQERGDSGLPFAEMYRALARRRDEGLRNVFGAAWPLLTGAKGKKSPGRISISSLDAVAKLVREAAPDTYDKLASGAPPIGSRRARLGEVLRGLLKPDGKEPSQAEVRLGSGRKLADCRDLAALLCAEPLLSDSLAKLPEQIPNLSQSQLDSIRDLYDQLEERDAEAPLLMLFLVLERLERRSQILRILRKLVGQDDDLMATQTDVAAIGDRLLDDAEEAVAAAAPPVHSAPDGQAVVDASARFASISRGMTRELGIRRDGKWGQRLAELRAKAARNFEELCKNAPDAIAEGLPQVRIMLAGGVPANRPMVDSPVRQETFDRAYNYALILKGVGESASSCGFASAHGRSLEAAEKELSDYCEGLIALAGDPDAEHGLLDDWVEATARITEALLDRRTADVLHRRISAAHAARTGGAAA